MDPTAAGLHGRGVEAFNQEADRSDTEELTAEDSEIQTAHREDFQYGSIQKNGTADDADTRG
jgi:hypothetical protein